MTTVWLQYDYSMTTLQYDYSSMVKVWLQVLTLLTLILTTGALDEGSSSSLLNRLSLNVSAAKHNVM